MKFRLHFYVLLILGGPAGCGTLCSAVDSGCGELTPYSGTQASANGHGTQMDVPLSIVADTLLLPITIPKALFGGSSKSSVSAFDPNAIERNGRIVEKRIVRMETRPMADNGTRPKSSKEDRVTMIAIFSYSVRLSETETIAVETEFPGYEIGNCVKAFLSSNPHYPRITQIPDCQQVGRMSVALSAA